MDINKRIRLNPGYVLSFMVIAIPSFAWKVSYSFSNYDAVEAVFVTLMRTSAFAGMAMFAWSLILSGRYKIFDTLFKGLDKVYVAHRFFGTASLLLLLLHPLGYTLLHIYNVGFNDLFNHFFGFRDLGFLFGRASLYGLLIIGVWSIFMRVKHETFIKIHRLLGVMFVLGALHAFMAGGSSVLATNAFMYWYMLILSLLAVITFLHYSVFSDLLHPYCTYTLTRVRLRPGNVWEVTMQPKYRILNFVPGQFVYLSFTTLPDQGYHPFTIASSNRRTQLQFYIKELGDLTSMFDRLRSGDVVRVRGPYGGFVFDDTAKSKQLWIGAGIGITPFLSKARSLQHAKRSPHVELVYAVPRKTEAFAQKELLRIEDANHWFNCTVVSAAKFGKLSLADLQDQFGDLHEYAIYLCGPPAMMAAYAQQAAELGVSDHFYIEEFTI